VSPLFTGRALSGLGVVPTEKGVLRLTSSSTTARKQRRKNSFFVVTDTATGLIFEAWAPNEKSALNDGRFRRWARSPSHEGLRRILRVVPGEPYPVLDDEANYFALARERTARDAAMEAAILAELSPQQRAKFEAARAAEEAAHAATLATMRADQAARRERRAALDARRGVQRPIFDLPTQDPDTGEWI